MYAYPPPPKAPGGIQAKLIVNLVVVVFLLIGILLVLQYFNFLYLRDVPVIGGWLMDTYEHVFGVPRVLILHGDDSIGDWVAMRDMLSKRLIFYSEELDVRKFESGIGQRLGEYGLIIVEDVRTIDKSILISFEEYVKSGKNLIWVGDAGTQGVVEYEGKVIANQTGWRREIVCIDSGSLSSCDCHTVNATSTCKFLSEKAEQIELDFTTITGAAFSKNVVTNGVGLEIVNPTHWATVGVKRLINLPNVTKITAVSNEYTTALLGNINVSTSIDEAIYPGIIVNDVPGAWGAIVYFAYPPEETPEIFMPLVERLRY